MANTQSMGRHRATQPGRSRSPVRRRTKLAVVSLVVVVAATCAVYVGEHPGQAPPHGSLALSTTPNSYIGVYSRDAFPGVQAFTAATGVKPRVVVYYSGWLEPFRTGFARTAVGAGQVPLVQINPTGINLTAIAAGQYDSYLSTYAKAVRAYHSPVILSFGHEMNGYWYSWGSTHTSPAAFVAAWRHIVTLFRALGAHNVTWLWTVNAIQTQATSVAAPNPWWPGGSYVSWVGIDGYFTTASSQFSSVFGPTIADIRAFTRKPILIAETSAAPDTGQPSKISDLFAGAHLYGLLGFVWFNTIATVDWRLTSPEAIAAFRRGAHMYYRVPS